MYILLLVFGYTYIIITVDEKEIVLLFSSCLIHYHSVWAVIVTFEFVQITEQLFSLKIILLKSLKYTLLLFCMHALSVIP